MIKLYNFFLQSKSLSQSSRWRATTFIIAENDSKLSQND